MVRYDEDRRWHVVRPGETLAMIAEQELGDPRLDELLFEQNQGRLMPDGGRLENPNLLRPGWVIELPFPRFIPPASTIVPELAPPASSAPSPARPPTTAPHQRRPRVVIELPSGSVIAFSLWMTMASALLLALLRNRRAYLPEPPEPGICRYHPETATVTRQVIDRGQALAADEPWDDAPPAGPAEHAAAPPLPTSALDDVACADPGRPAVVRAKTDHELSTHDGNRAAIGVRTDRDQDRWPPAMSEPLYDLGWDCDPGGGLAGGEDVGTEGRAGGGADGGGHLCLHDRETAGWGDPVVQAADTGGPVPALPM